MAQLLIASEAHGRWRRGDILAIKPDGEPWGREEVMDRWTATGGAPADFPNPWFSVIRMDTELCDLNLTEPDRDFDPLNPDDVTIVNERSWYFDIQDLTPAKRAEVREPGSIVRVARTQRSAIKTRRAGISIPLDLSDDDGQRHRRPETKPPRLPKVT